jgi:hypothetical protein
VGTSKGYRRGPKENLVGRRFGKLEVLSLLPEKRDSNYVWLCRCDCGKEKPLMTTCLNFRGIESCGCDYYPSGPGSPCWKGCGEIGKNFWNHQEISARARDLKLEITIQEAWDLFLFQDRKCKLSGVVLTFGMAPNYKNNKNHVECTASLDRIDSSLGYTMSNVQWVHKWINIMKNDMSDDEFVGWCQKVSEISSRT